MRQGSVAPLRAANIDGTGSDVASATGMRITVELDAEQAAFLRVLMRERGHLAYSDTALDVFEAGIVWLSER